MHFKTRMFLIMVGCSSGAFAADLPSVEQGAGQYDKATCLSQYTDNCINSICLTSSSTDCQSTCRKSAEDKCQSLQN